EIKTQMCLSILDDCIRHRAKLKGFVVMTHHIHLLVRPNSGENISQLMQPLKENAVARIKPLLNDFELNQLSMQNGLSRRTFWKRSFRGNPILTDSVFLQKLHYIHANPIRATKCELAEDYLWSSAQLRQLGWFDEEDSIDLKLVSEFYVRLLAN
ncbi:MAG: transposase, partial [Armatimonadota bacterium]